MVDGKRTKLKSESTVMSMLSKPSIEIVKAAIWTKLKLFTGVIMRTKYEKKVRLN